MKSQKTDPDHCEENADGAKNGLGWCVARDFLREIEDFDEAVQRRDDALPFLGLLGLGFHG
jgi:hypothetical protein